MTLRFETTNARRSGRGAAVIAAIIVAALWLSGCGSHEPAQDESDVGSDELPDQEISDFVLRETRGDRLEWVFRAETAEIYEARNEILSHNVAVDFYDEDGSVGSVLTARSATVDRRTNAMEAEGDVVLRTDDGRTLETQTLRYAPAEGKILTEDFVRIVDGANVLTGYGLESEPDLREGSFQIKRDVKATVLDLPDESDGG